MGIHNDFTPEELSRQNEQLMQDLHHLYDTRAGDIQSLARIRTLLQKHDVKTPYETQSVFTPAPPLVRRGEKENTMKLIGFRSSSNGKVWQQRLGALAAVVIAAMLVGSLLFVLSHSRQPATGGHPNHGQTTPIVQPSPTSRPANTPTPTKTPVTFRVTGIDMAVQPSSIAGLACGSNLTVTYTATFHVPANSPGGTVDFTYTVNNGRGSTPASIQFAPGQTTKTYTFTSSGALSPDNTFPGNGGVMTTSPNSFTSQLIKPAGTCTQASFQVTGVDLVVSPSSIAGIACNTQVTFTYTATFHAAAGSGGGTVQFMWTANNGRSSTNASVTFAPGQTTQTYTFTVSGTLPPDHTFPGVAEVITTSPNSVNSPQVKPSGQCQ
ncbi:MAG TPA: hypothetical protein VKV20_19665 [Ktedonobacteraceae bacterium]|jgi:hypothetical protein|nr:hypothetical protein [Ktedonobacteraceae bacterium]